MPTIAVSKEDLCELVGGKVSEQALLETLALTKVVHEAAHGDEMTLEVPSDRPDLLCAEGIARELRGLLGIETGLKHYRVRLGDVSLRIDPSVEEIRPYIVSAIAENIVLTDSTIKQSMQLQEKLHISYGRNRRVVSIGIHDLDKVNRKLTYAAIEPEKIRFVPLGETKPMNGKEILLETPKGREYGHIIESFPRYPLLFDSEERVLSLPPIINGVVTTVTEETRNLLLDVTGTDKKLVKFVLNMIVSSLADRGASIKSVRIMKGRRREYTPDLSPLIHKLKASDANQLIGVKLNPKQVEDMLRKMRYGIKSRRGDVLTVEVPCYRSDILHDVDLIEDVAIGYGIGSLTPEMPFTPTIGCNLDITQFSKIAREIMVGFAFQEILNFVMTSPAVIFDKMNRSIGRVVTVANPVVVDYSILRQDLLPGLLNFLSYNKHVTFPQRVFECGDVVAINEERPTRTENQRRLAAAICDHIVSYEDIQSVLYGLLKNLNIIGWSIEPTRDPSFISGRCAAIKLHESHIGLLGEIHPNVLQKFGLENPTTALEINLHSCMETAQASARPS